MRENNIVRLRPARSLSFSVLCLYSIIVVRSVYDMSIIISCFIFSFHPFFPQIYTHTSYFRPLPHENAHRRMASARRFPASSLRSRFPFKLRPCPSPPLPLSRRLSISSSSTDSFDLESDSSFLSRFSSSSLSSSSSSSSSWTPRVRRAEFVSSTVRVEDCPSAATSNGKILPEFAVIGRSNVGKSRYVTLLQCTHAVLSHTIIHSILILILSFIHVHTRCTR